MTENKKTSTGSIYLILDGDVCDRLETLAREDRASNLSAAFVKAVAEFDGYSQEIAAGKSLLLESQTTDDAEFFDADAIGFLAQWRDPDVSERDRRIGSQLMALPETTGRQLDDICARFNLASHNEAALAAVRVVDMVRDLRAQGDTLRFVR